jgi:glycosyltransferase involved in cell wall biosynthesis
MTPVSVVIICKNEVSAIGDTIKSVLPVSDDIVCADNGSTDGTQKKITESGGRLIETPWEGYGKTKSKGVAVAKHDWILTIDADEPIDAELQRSILQNDFSNAMVVYQLHFKTFLGDKHIRFGEWGRDYKHTRLFNRTKVQWDESPVHENLLLPPGIITKELKGYVLHRTVNNEEEYLEKTKHYAMLNAEKYHRQGKKTNWINLYISPGFSFILNYFFRLGFLDGRFGFVCAKMTAYYTYLKYKGLKELNRGKTITRGTA